MQEHYPKLEDEIHSALLRFVSSVADQNSPVMSNVKSHLIHEGHASALLRPSGEHDVIEMRSFSTENMISKDTVLYGSLDELAAAFRPIGEALATDKEKLMFEVLHEATEAVGNVVDAKGRPFSADLVLEAIEKLHIDFDAEGKAKMPTLVVSPDLMEKINEMSTGPEGDKLKKKFDDLMVLKRMEWRAREADRTLVG